MVAHRVEIVEVAATSCHLRRRMGGHLFVEYAIAQGLRGIDLGRGLRQSNLEIARNDLDDLRARGRSAKKFGFAVSAVNAHASSARGPPRSWRHYRGAVGCVHSFLAIDRKSTRLNSSHMSI